VLTGAFSARSLRSSVAARVSGFSEKIGRGDAVVFIGEGFRGEGGKNRNESCRFRGFLDRFDPVSVQVSPSQR
jgi:hypothetical protein